MAISIKKSEAYTPGFGFKMSGTGTGMKAAMGAPPPPPTPAIDSNHIYVYSMNESTGTTLANTGQTVGGDLSISGVETTDYILNSPDLFNNYGAFRLLTTTNNNAKASSSGISAPTDNFGNTGITIEACFITDPSGLSLNYGPNAAKIMVLSGIAPVFGGAIGVAFGIQVQTDYRLSILWGTGAGTLSNVVPSNTLNHVMVTYNKYDTSLDYRGHATRIYLNGVQISAAGNQVPPAQWTSTNIEIGRHFRGVVAQARVSNIARDLAYAQQTYATLSAM